MEALGFVDLSPDVVPVNLATGVNTGFRVNLKNCQTVTFILFKGAGTSGQDPVLTLNTQNAKTGGTSQTLAALTKYYVKSATTLAGTEQWSLVSLGGSFSSATLTGEAAKQGVYAFPINATSLPSGFAYLSMDISQPAAAQVGGGLWMMSFLDVARAPAKLLAGLN